MPAARPHVLIDALNLRQGGGMTVMRRIAQAMPEAGLRATVLLSHDDPAPTALPDGVELRGVARARGPVRAILFRHLVLTRLCKDLGVDALISFNYHSPVALPQATYHVNVIPFLPWAVRCRAVGLPRALLQRHYAARALRASALNLFESCHLRDLAATACGPARNPGLAYTGVETATCAATPGPSEPEAPVVTVTSGAAHKRNDLTVAAFRKYRRRNPAARLCLVGDPVAIVRSLPRGMRADVEQDPAITFPGYLDREDLYRLLAGARALLACSERESFYMVALEAMACGCPVIVADTSSARESVGAAGLLFPAGDPAAAAACLERLDDVTLSRSLSRAGAARAAEFEARSLARDFVARVRTDLLAPGRAETGA